VKNRYRRGRKDKGYAQIVKISILQAELGRQAEELRAMGVRVLDRDGRPTCHQTSDPIPAEEHHRVSLKDETPKNRVHFNLTWANTAGRDPGNKVRVVLKWAHALAEARLRAS
jgi:hypothetical protein